MNKPNLKIVVATIFILALTIGGIFGYRIAIGTIPSGGPYYLQVPTSTWTYQVGIFSNGTYYMVNGSNWHVDLKSTDFTDVMDWALANGTSVYVKEGAYTVTRGIKLYNNTHDNRYIELDKGAELTLANGVNDTMWSFEGTGTYDGEEGSAYIANITFIGGVLNGNGLNNRGDRGDGMIYDNDCIWANFIEDSTFSGIYTAHSRDRGISLRNGRRNLIDNCIHRISDGDTGVAEAPDGLMLAYGHDNTIRNCKTYDLPNDGINLYGEYNSLIDGCYVTNATAGTYIDGSASYKGFNNRILNTVFDNVGCGIAFSNNAHDNEVGEGCVFRNSNTAGSNKGYGVWLLGDHNVVKGGIFTANAIYDIMCEGNGYYTIKNNHFWNATDTCVRLGVSNVLIQSNNFFNYTNAIINGPDSINIQVIDNNFQNTASATCIYSYYVTYNWTVERNLFDLNIGDGIFAVEASSDYITFQHNTILQASATPITVYGVHSVVRWNIGYKTEYSASVSNATSTTWTFATGLAVTPLQVHASFNDTGITSWKWSYSTGTLTITAGLTIPSAAVTCYADAESWNYP